MHSSTLNCSLPPEGSNFVAATPVRGTFEILSTCISVLVLCTWSVVHLNVPPQIKTKYRNEKRNIKTWLHHAFKASEGSRVKAGWMIVNIIVPEWILVKALTNFLEVRRLKSDFGAQALEDDVPWSDAHTHFANMSGFGISFADLDMPQVAVESRPRSTPTDIGFVEGALENSNTLGANEELLRGLDSSAWARRAAKFLSQANAEDASRYVNNILSVSKALEQGWKIDPWNSELVAEALDSPDLRDLGGDNGENDIEIYVGILLLRASLWIPDAPQLLLLRKLRIIDSLPKVDPEDLDDRSKGNLFVKLIAIGQICWFVLQFLVRLSIGITITQLEVMVFAFTVVSIAPYVLAWHRPKDVTYTLRLNATNYPTCSADIIKIGKQSPEYLFSPSLRNTIWLSNNLINRDSSDGGLELLIGCAVMSIFGAFHCLAWHSAFPSKIEQILWRTSSIITTVLPASLAIAILLVTLPFYLHIIIYYGSFLIFVLARLSILVEGFRSLAFQPPDAFQATWASNVPHI